MSSDDQGPLLTAEDLREAENRIRPYAHRTPVLTSSYLDERSGAELLFKCENFQRIGAFKFRGASVVAHSSGNHAQALALAARLRGTRATIVMPTTASAVKVAAVRGYGAEVVSCQPTVEDREQETERVLRETGGTLIHPYNDRRIIAGQATAAMELLEQVEGLDLVLAPVGGGGLLSGTTLAAHHFSPSTRVIGVEPAAADDAYRSLEVGEIQPSIDPKTIADGLLTSLGDLTFAVISELTDRIVTVSEEAIVEAMRTVWERMKIIIEPSAAVPVAAILAGQLDPAGQRVGIILSGGNVDLDRLPWSTRPSQSSV
jgi:threonine dehydratase